MLMPAGDAAGGPPATEARPPPTYLARGRLGVGRCGGYIRAGPVCRPVDLYGPWVGLPAPPTAGPGPHKSIGHGHGPAAAGPGPPGGAAARAARRGDLSRA